MNLTEIIVLIVTFVLINGAFVAAEFALIGSPKTTIDHRAAQGDRLASRMMQILDSPRQQDQYLATSQIGITLASLGLGIYGEHELAGQIKGGLGHVGWLGTTAIVTIASACSLALLTMLHIVIGEMLPKTLALQTAERVGRFAYWPMRILLLLFYPFVSLLTGIASVFLRIMGIRRTERTSEQFHTPEELALIVEESAEGGALPADSNRLLQELFEFGDRTAGQAMTPRVRVVGIPVGATPDAVRAILMAHRHTRYPIFDGDLDHIVGMLHVKDLLRRLMANERIGATDVKPIPVLPNTAALDDVLTTMRRAQAHMAVVVDEHGGTEGVLSLEDLFEEVVGEIDEGVSKAPPMTVLEDGSVRVAGTVRLDELGQHFDLDLEHEDVDSVSGLVLARLDRLPLVGDVVEYGRLRVEVTATSGRGVREARAQLLPPPESEST